uniref:Ig-like domain-containing protein n=1 Tax=Calidris pygmaea TaxID=425635 RepID=A0A8C3PHI0_9CHAR
MRIFLGWTLFPVWSGWAVTGPKEVTAKQGSPLAVSCSYKPGYELYPKYWCRPGFLRFCFTYIAQTNGSEVTVTQGRVSIRDNHTSRSFMVTFSGVTTEDADWYSCGVKRRLWFNPQHSMEVMVSPGKAGARRWWRQWQRQHSRVCLCLCRLPGRGERSHHRAGIPGGVSLGELHVPARR